MTYYDFRNNTPAPGVPTDYWFIHCHPNTTCTSPAHWSETHVSGGFDVENAPVSRGYFMGDYEGLAANGTSLGALFAHPSATDKDNTYFGTVSP